MDCIIGFLKLNLTKLTFLHYIYFRINTEEFPEACIWVEEIEDIERNLF